MSNCHSKYLNKIYNKNNKLNIDNDDYVNVVCKIDKKTNQIFLVICLNFCLNFF